MAAFAHFVEAKHVDRKRRKAAAFLSAPFACLTLADVPHIRIVAAVA
jgi:hypothetical protein